MIYIFEGDYENSQKKTHFYGFPYINLFFKIRKKNSTRKMIGKIKS